MSDFENREDGLNPEEIVDAAETETVEEVVEDAAGEVKQAEAPQKKGPGSILGLGQDNIIGIAAAVIVLALIITSIVSAASKANPKNLLRTGFENARDQFQEMDQYATVDRVIHGGSIDITVDLSKIEELKNSDGDAVPGIIHLALYSNWEKKTFALEADATLSKKSVLDAKAYISPDEASAASNTFFGKTKYGVNLKNASKNLKGSVLDPAKDTDYSLAEDAYSELVKFTKDINKVPSRLQKEFDTVKDEAEDIFWETIRKHGTYSKDSEKIDIGEKTLNTTVITVEMDGPAITAAIKDLTKWAKDSKSLKALVEDGAKQYVSLMAIRSGKAAEEGAAADLVEQFYKQIDQFAEQFSDPETKFDGSFVGTFYIEKSGNKMVQADCTLKMGAQKYRAIVTVGPDPKDPEIISVDFRQGDQKTVVSYTVSEDTSSAYSGKLSLKSGKDTLATATFNWEKKTGDIRVKLDITDAGAANEMTKSIPSVDLKGTMKKSGKTTTITLGKLSAKVRSTGLFGMTTEIPVEFKDLGTTIVIKESDGIPKVSGYTDLLKMKETDVEKMVDKAKDAIDELQEILSDTNLLDVLGN